MMMLLDDTFHNFKYGCYYCCNGLLTVVGCNMAAGLGGQITTVTDILISARLNIAAAVSDHYGYSVLVATCLSPIQGHF